jgi:hypothetical protein
MYRMTGRSHKLGLASNKYYYLKQAMTRTSGGGRGTVFRARLIQTLKQEGVGSLIFREAYQWEEQ